MEIPKRFKKDIEKIISDIDRLTSDIELELLNQALESIEKVKEEDNLDLLLLPLSASISDPLKDKIYGVYDIYKSQLASLKGRFGIDRSDTEVTAQIADFEVQSIGKKIEASLAGLSSTLFFLKSTEQKIETTKLLEELKKGVNLIRVEAEKGLLGYRAGMEVRQAKKLEEAPKFAYVGAVDKRNRPFCAKILKLNKLWSLEEIELLNNEQISPVLLYGGGYNCRHTWIYTKRQ